MEGNGLTLVSSLFVENEEGAGCGGEDGAIVTFYCVNYFVVMFQYQYQYQYQSITKNQNDDIENICETKQNNSPLMIIVP